jgi:hypothetical protein
MKTIDYKAFEHTEGSEAWKARKLLEMYEGHQLKWVEAALNGDIRGGQGKRYDWRERGFVPRMRNIIKPVVEKSASLFNYPAKYEILPATSTSAKPVVDATLNNLLASADWVEFSQQMALYTRLLRSTCTFQLKIVPDGSTTSGGIYRFTEARGDAWVPMLLHAGNSVVRGNVTRTKVTELAYITNGCPGERDGWTYIYVCPQYSQEYFVKDGKEVAIGDQIPNYDGIVPASMTYDTSKPRTGMYCKVPEDIASFQEMYNSHLTDLDFALTTQKGQSLFIMNAEVKGGNEAPSYAMTGNSIESIEGANNPGGPGYKMRAPEQPSLGGIGSVITLKAGKGATIAPSAEFKGPNVDLAAHDAVMRTLLQDLASDWSVRLKVGGQGQASSGFQLIVEEMDNLELREQQAKAYQGALRRMYDITKVLYPELTDGQLQVIFAPASLPTNKAEDLKLWVDKITAGLASRVDYFMATEGLSAEEAVLRVQEVDASSPNTTTPVDPEGTVESAD